MLGLFARKPKTPADRRRHRREPVRLEAEIVITGRSLRCTTDDLSAGGARLCVPASRVLPGLFELRVPERRLVKTARMVWRDGHHLGVEFAR